ncbi:MAG: sulfatase [Marinilabiliaceae bacterium]|nr:sulfatase [Marinilabiliaceae bacterium]
MNNFFKTSLLTFSVFSLLGGCQSPEKKEQQPNILFIMADDHTSQAWGIYGGVLKDYVHTPNISRLAEEGCVLENCLVSNSICSPSRATILTGQYSHLNGVPTLADALEPQKENIAKELQKGGYETAIIGKWHLKKEPSGFDYYCVLPGQGVYWDPVLKTRENWKDHHGGGKAYSGFSTDVIADMSIDWMKNRDDSKPFMMMCHFKATHEPFDYPDRHKDLYKDVEIPAPASIFDKGPETTGRSFKGQALDNLADRYMKASADPDKWWCKYPGLPFTTEGLDKNEARMKTYQKFVKDFMRCGAAIDDNIGKLLEYLEESGLAENTIVIYTADQGYYLGEHGWFDKRMIYEESIHMPFVIRYPKEIPAGTRNSDIIENVDFSALFADYAGIDYPKEMQGYSFRENLKGHTPDDWRKYGYYRYWLHSVDRPAHFGIRGDRYKLVFFYGQPLGMKGAQQQTTEPAWEFFDLEKDPQELHNAIQEPEYQEIITQMKDELKKKREQLGDTDEQYPVMQKIFEKHWN